MKKFLDIVEPLLPAAQADRIAAIVAQRQRKGMAVTPAEVTEEIARLSQLIRGSNQFAPSFQLRLPDEPDDIMEGEDFNASMEELIFDLQTLYDITNRLTGGSRSLQKVLHSRLEELRGKICRITDDILSYQRLKNTERFARVISQGFADARNATRAGSPAQVDAETRSLKLRENRRIRHHQERGINPAQVRIENLSAGLTGVASRTFEPGNAIDPDPETFWADVLLADSPIRTDYTFVSGSTVTYDGALVEVGLLLGAPSFVTDVRALPFGEYPVDIIDVKYRQGNTWFQYPGYVDRSPSLDWLEWHGPRILADEVAFVFQQQTYQRRVYHIPRRLLDLSKFWEQLLDEEAQLTLNDSILTDFQKQNAVADSRFRSLQEALRRYGLELERRALPALDPDGRTSSDATVLHREIDAVAETMLSDPKDPGLRLRPLRETRKEDDTEEELVAIERVEYVFGAREIQANDADYLPEGVYATQKFKPDSGLLQVQVDVDEEHPTFTDTNGSFRKTSIEYDVEIAPGRRVPLLAKGLTTVQDELLEIDRVTRQDTTRFPAASTTVTVRKNGVVLTPTLYTAVLLTDSRLRITIAQSAFTRTARYQITYTPTADQDKFDIEATFDSVGIDRPETFEGTDESGSVQLAYYPFVNFEVVNNETQFRREAKRSARWFWVGGAAQSILDGRMYGAVNTTLASDISAAATTIPLGTTAGVNTAGGKIKIGTEILSYTGVSGSDLTGAVRGIDGTTAQAHSAGLQITGNQSYEPVVVTVGSIPAFNITNYLSGKHPAFLSTQDDSLRYEFLHLGDRLYFNRPVVGKPIVVRYRWMSQYIQVHASLRSHTVGRVPHTPILNRFFIETESTAL